MQFQRQLVLLAATLMVWQVAGCCSKKKKIECRGEVVYTGGNYSASRPYVTWGGGSTEVESHINACWRYCYNADPTFEGIFAIWLDTPKGKVMKRRWALRKKKLTRKEAVTWGPKDIRRQFHKCVTRCQTNANAGKNGLKFRPAVCKAK